jgi:hypothetical protein
MSYSDFKNIEDVKQKFHLTVTSTNSLFQTIQPIEYSHIFQEILQENVPLALNINTEKARSELIISPLLVELRKLMQRQISLFSGIDFSIDETLGLTGYCDFILSQSPNQIFLEQPIVCLVEAKNETIKVGYAQCIAEMVAAKLFNERQAIKTSYIIGVVTTGSNWKFLKYQENTVFIDFDEYLISQADKILGILLETITNSKPLC